MTYLSKNPLNLVTFPPRETLLSKQPNRNQYPGLKKPTDFNKPKVKRKPKVLNKVYIAPSRPNTHDFKKFKQPKKRRN